MYVRGSDRSRVPPPPLSPCVSLSTGTHRAAQQSERNPPPSLCRIGPAIIGCRDRERTHETATLGATLTKRRCESKPPPVTILFLSDSMRAYTVQQARRSARWFRVARSGLFMSELPVHQSKSCCVLLLLLLHIVSRRSSSSTRREKRAPLPPLCFLCFMCAGDWWTPFCKLLIGRLDHHCLEIEMSDARCVCLVRLFLHMCYLVPSHQRFFFWLLLHSSSPCFSKGLAP